MRSERAEASAMFGRGNARPVPPSPQDEKIRMRSFPAGIFGPAPWDGFPQSLFLSEILAAHERSDSDESAPAGLPNPTGAKNMGGVARSSYDRAGGMEAWEQE